MKAWIVLLAALTPATTSAQVMMPPPQSAPLDSTARYYQSLLVALRDTMGLVATRSNELRRDLGSAGDVTVLAKAERLGNACATARVALEGALPAIARAVVPPARASVKDSIRTAIRALDSGLERHCLRGLSPAGPGARADTLRAWGRYRTAELQHLLVVYHSEAARFASALGFKLPPTQAP